MNRKQNIKELKQTIRQNVLNLLEEYNFNFLHIKENLKKEILAEKGKQVIYSTLTGINKLEAVLKNILKQIETSYKSLTTDTEQRNSFREHFVNAIENLLNILDKNFYAAQNVKSALGGMTEAANNIEIKYDNSKFDDNGILKTEDASKKEEKSDEEVERDAFKIPGKDETGADEAFDIFNKVSSQIEDTYQRLRNKLDRTVFRQWLPKNLDAYMKAWDEEISATLNKVDA